MASKHIALQWATRRRMTHSRVGKRRHGRALPHRYAAPPRHLTLKNVDTEVAGAAGIKEGGVFIWAPCASWRHRFPRHPVVLY